MEEVESLASSAEEEVPAGIPLNLWDTLRETKRAQPVVLDVPNDALPGGMGPQQVEAILVDDDSETFWLAVPGSAWPRRKAGRSVPLAWVEKALAARVMSEASALDADSPEYVGVALLRMRPAARPFLTLPPDEFTAGVFFLDGQGVASLPDGDALLETCSPHLPAGAPAAPAVLAPAVAPAAAAEDDFAGRLGRVESSIDSMRSLIEGYFGSPPAPPGLRQRREAGPPTSALPAARGIPVHIPTTAKYAGGPKVGSSTSPIVKRSAVAAGIDPRRLAGLEHILRGPGGRLPPEPAPSLPTTTSAAPPADDDIDGEELSTGGEELPPVERAVLALTRLTGQLVSARPPERDPLERALEGVSGSLAGDPSSSLSLRKGAAARRALVEAVTARPEAIYGSVEQLMVEAIQGGPASHAAGSGSSLETANPFVYLEHRSRVANYRSTVCWLWQIAAIHKALMDGRPKVARARAALALAAGEQFSIDGGSWDLAWEMTLMDEPPYDAFARHGQDQSRAPGTRLIDPRWLEVHLARLRDQDDMKERRRRLQGHRPPPAPTPHAGGEEQPPPKGHPKWRPKAPPKGEGAPPHRPKPAAA